MKTILFLFLVCSFLPSCFTGNGNNNDHQPINSIEDIEDKDSLTIDTTLSYPNMLCRENCFVVISKKELKLYVCENLGNDTVRVAEYPVCLSKNLGQKEKSGDMKTPECTWDKPFKITQIQDASDWSHDFGDGRGSILAYGNWFMRLATPGFSGIGIHGSTNNESTVPGRDSEGCIRMRNTDLDHFKEHYAFKGMKVVIKKEEEGLKKFEEKYYE